MAIEKWHVLFCDGFIENVASWEIYELSKWSQLHSFGNHGTKYGLVKSMSRLMTGGYLGYTTYRFLGKSMKLCVKLWILFKLIAKWISYCHV